MQGLLDSMPGTPSAISQMLGLLMQHPPAGQPGQAPPPPVAPTAMPPQGEPQAEPPQSLLGKIHDFIDDRLGGNVPAEYKNSGLLSPDEIRQAKPGIMEELAHSDSYRKNLNRMLEMKGVVAQAQEHGRVMQLRQKMGELFPEKPDETHTDRMNRIERMFTYATANGLPEAQELGKVVAELAIPSKAPNEAPHTLATDKGILQWNPTTKKYEPTGYRPPDAHEKYTWATRPDGQTVLVPQSVAAAGGFTKPETDDPQKIVAGTRAQAAISEMNNANGGLNAYEDKLVNGTADISGLNQFIGSVGDSFTNEDMKSKAAQSAALAELNKKNPDLARYIRRGLSFAEGESMISQRPSDYRTKLAAFLSTASAGASPDMIADIRSRRSSILTPLNASKLGQKAAGTGHRPTLTQSEYDAGIRKGHTPAEIASHYDVSKLRTK